MQFLNTVHGFIFNIFYNKHWNWYLFSLFSLVLKQQFNELINGKSETNRDQKLNLLFLQRHDQFQKFRIRLVKSRQKTLQRH